MAARGAIAPLQYRHSLTTCPHHLQPFVVVLGTYLGATCQSSERPSLNNGLMFKEGISATDGDVIKGVIKMKKLIALLLTTVSLNVFALWTGNDKLRTSSYPAFKRYEEDAPQSILVGRSPRLKRPGYAERYQSAVCYPG